MFILLVIIHVIVCLVLIATILLQAGRGGGLTEAFGDSTQSVLGTQAPVILKRATEVSAVAFLITSLLLGMLTTRRGRSLFERANMPMAPVQPVSSQAPLNMALPGGAEDMPGKVTDAADKAVSGTEYAAGNMSGQKTASGAVSEAAVKTADDAVKEITVPSEQTEDTTEVQ